MFYFKIFLCSLLSVLLQPVKVTGQDTSEVVSFLVKIPGGTYPMGDQFAEGWNYELPVHSVTISTFYLSKYEVTFDEFDAFCSATKREKPMDSTHGRGAKPAMNVDWYDAVEYCNWLSEQHGLRAVYTLDKTTADPNNKSARDTKKWTVTADWIADGYRLPTEAEWEFAARAVRNTSGVAQGGGKVRFGNGRDSIDPFDVNFDSRKKHEKSFSIVGNYRSKTVQVDELPANSFGLKNMTGNVSEWCWDWFDSTYYQHSENAQNPHGPISGEERVYRGGSWQDIPITSRVACRFRWSPSQPYSYVGFRIARRM